MKTNQILKDNWILALIVVALIVFLAVKLSPDKDTQQEYFKVETSENQIIRQAPETSIVRSVAPETSVTQNTEKEIRWVVRLDGSEGHHVPHLLGMGESNGVGGFDFVSRGVASVNDPYGRLEDGTYFIKEDLLTKAGLTSFAELKSAEFGWVPKKMVLAEIDGQRAYVYQP